MKLMNYRNVFIVGIILISAALVPAFPVLAATSTSTQNCTQQIDQKAEAEYQFQAQSISVAEASGQVNALAQTYTSTYDSVFDRWAFDSQCNVRLTSVNAVFKLSNTTGFAGYAIAMEDPASSHVINVTLQQHNKPAANTNPSWSGYEFSGSFDSNNPVWESIADWSVPAVTSPRSGACSNPGCSLLVWPGLVHSPGGNPSGIAQTGSESAITSAGTGYDLWYEFYPEQPQTIVCDYNVYSGDSIHAYVLNQGWNGGDITKWNLQISDNTRGQACTVTGHPNSSIGKPYYGDFIAERLGGTATLPAFTSFSIAGNVYYSGSATGIYVPYTNGWYTLYVMQNGCSPPNISTSAVNSGNSFTETYNNSCGT